MAQNALACGVMMLSVQLIESVRKSAISSPLLLDVHELTAEMPQNARNGVKAANSPFFSVIIIFVY